MLPLNRFSRRAVPAGGLPIVRHWRREEGLRGNGNAPSEKCPLPCIQLGDFFKRLAAGALAPDGDDHGGDKAEEAEDPEHAVEAVRSVGHRDERLGRGHGEAAGGAVEAGGGVAHTGGVGFGGVREDREAHSHDDRGEDDAGEDDGPVTGHIAEDGAKYGEDDQHTHDRDLAPAKVGDEG